MTLATDYNSVTTMCALDEAAVTRSTELQIFGLLGYELQKFSIHLCISCLTGGQKKGGGVTQRGEYL